MKELSAKKIKQYYFIENDVIFDINGANLWGDSCAKSYVEVNLPSITITKGTSTSTTIMYLDTYIQDGDKYVTPEGGNSLFKKVIHGETEEEKTFANYYKQLCEEEIESRIEANFDKSNDEIVQNKTTLLGIPAWMIKGAGYTILPDIQIDITTTYVKNKKEDIVQKAAYNAAKNATEAYGYTLTTPEKAEDVKVTAPN